MSEGVLQGYLSGEIWDTVLGGGISYWLVETLIFSNLCDEQSGTAGEGVINSLLK